PINATTEPIERSIPPVMMTNATPMLKMANSELRRTRLPMLYSERNRSGFSNPVTRQTKTSRPRMPKIFFICLVGDHASYQLPAFRAVWSAVKIREMHASRPSLRNRRWRRHIDATLVQAVRSGATTFMDDDDWTALRVAARA